MKLLRSYAAAWRDVFRRRTIRHVAYDALLLAGLLVLLFLTSLSLELYAQPLQPFFEQAQSLQEQGAPEAVQQLLAEQYAVGINGALLKWAVTAFGLLVVFVAGYAWLKTRAWSGVKPQSFKRNLTGTLVVYLVAALLPVPFLLVSPAAAVYVAFATALLGAAALPVGYATDWRLPRPRILAVLGLLLVTYLVVVNLLAFSIRLNAGLYAVLFVAWLLVFAAFGRYYLAREVRRA